MRGPRRPWLSAALVALLAVLPVGAAGDGEDAPGGGGQPSRDRLEGHGGPIKAVAARGDRALTGGFDNALGYWDLSDGARRTWLDGHDAAVTTVLFVGENRALSAGDDFTAILWDLDAAAPLRRFRGHQGKIQGLAASADGARFLTASWDGAVGLWRADQDAPVALMRGHRGSVNDVVLSAGGARAYSASSDGSIRVWDLEARAETRVLVKHGFGVNVLALNEDAGWLAYGATDGVVRVVDLETGDKIAALSADRRPILALSLSPDKTRLGFGDGEGHVSVARVDGPASAWSIERDFRAAARGPIWALDFTADGRVLAAGLDDYAALWPVGVDPGAAPFDAERRAFQVDPDTVSNGERQFVRKCSVCHALGPGPSRRAGPTLHDVFGRRAGALPDYIYSPALKGSEIVWSADTLDKLFDLGPDRFTPGSKMPVQRIREASDRADLISFLEDATRPAPAGASLKEEVK